MFVADLHCDTASLIYYTKQTLERNTCHIDLQKLKKGHYVAQWFAYFIDTHGIKEKPLMHTIEKMHQYFMQQLSLHQQSIMHVTSFKAYQKAKAEGKIAAFLSLEEGQAIEGDLNNIDKLYDMGIRMMTLTWNYPNDLGYPHSINQGLTAFGRETASYLNELPMLLDISHLSEKGCKDCAEYYKKPLIASHCNAQKVHSHTRNLSDESIGLISQSGGIIGVNFFSNFLDGSGYSKLEDIYRHIDHLYQKGGEDCVALGTDFDGIDCKLDVCNASEMDKLITLLAARYNDRIVEKFCYKNHERILLEVL